ncbi:armadillo-type protein [Gaertneriomyces semiglobifer]|nr:armadillo-type protein [Gaertneriomyces semiglobifer]
MSALVNYGDVPWDEFVSATCVPAINSSSKRRRLPALITLGKKLKHESSDLPDPCLVAIISNIIITLSKYSDSESRKSAVEVAKILCTEVHTKEKASKGFAKLLERETAPLVKVNVPPSLLHAYLMLTTTILCVLSKAGSSSPTTQSLTRTHAALLDALAISDGKRQRLFYYRARRASLQLLKASISEDLLQAAIDGAEKGIAWLGVVLDATYAHGRSDGIETRKPLLIQFYVKSVLSSRTPVPIDAIDSLRIFLKHFITASDFRTEILPNATRLLLRSPEVVLRVLDYTFRHFVFDMSQFFADSFVASLAGHLKSTNEVVRRDAIGLFATLCSKSAEEKPLVKVVDELVKAILTKAPSVDQRIGYYTCLGRLNPSVNGVAQKVADNVSALVAKESNESCAAYLMQSVASFVKTVLLQLPQSINAETLTQSIASGLADGKGANRRTWITLLCLAIDSKAFNLMKPEKQKKLINGVTDLVEKTDKAGVAVLDPKKDMEVMEGVSGLWWLMEMDLSQSVEKLLPVVTTAKSFLLVDKYFTKITTKEDQIRYYETLSTIVKCDARFQLVEQTDLPLLASALVWTLVGTDIPDVRRHACGHLLENTERSTVERLARLVALGLSKMLVEHQQISPEMKISRSSEKLGWKVFGALWSAIPDNTDEWVENLLMDLSIVACHPTVTSIAGEDAWIRLCFKARKDPKHVVGSLGPDYVRKWLSANSDSEPNCYGSLAETTAASMRKATLNAITLFTKVETSAMMRVVVPWAAGEVDNTLVRNVSAMDVEVWKMPEGQLYFDPTQKKKNDERQARSAEEKWERELRKELEKKGKTGAKTGAKDKVLSKAEKEAQQEQLKKEQAIRAGVHAVRLRVLNGLDVLDATLSGLRAAFGGEAVLQLWLEPMIKCILEGVILREHSKGGAMLVGDLAVDVFKRMGAVAGSLGEMQPMMDLVSTAVLKASGVETEFDVGAFLSDVLSELQEDLSEHADGFSPLTFTYIFPLLRMIILREGKLCSMKEKVTTELGIHAADVLLKCCGVAKERGTPVRGMVRCLRELVQRFPRVRGAGREGILVLCVGVTERGIDDEADIDPATAREDEEEYEAVVRELLDGMRSNEEFVRETCLVALSHLTVPATLKDLFDIRIWIARFDDKDVVKDAAEELWQESNGEDVLRKEYVDRVMVDVTAQSAALRYSAGRALAGCLASYRDTVDAVLAALYAQYHAKAAIPEPEYDAYGMVIPESLNKPDEWEARAGIAMALESCVDAMESLDVLRGLFSFLIEGEALGDRDERVQRVMLDAGFAAVNSHGKRFVRELIDILNRYLSEEAKPSETHDRIREACVILLGTLAKHLEPTDAMIPEVVAKLVDTLNTPSETVQIAVSECLPGVIKVNRSGARRLVEKLLHQLYTAEKYGERRGAAYGLAGVVKGCGFGSLREYGIMSSLKEAVGDKKHVKKREGALFAFETLSSVMGRLFEPYVIQILPLLLACYADSNREVREATQDACKVIMSKISGHCVKLVLPSLLNGLEDKNWRTKTGSIDVLSSFAYLAPKQLSMSLPIVVPRLVDVLADTHQKVQESARHALDTFGGVIQNPEIQALVPTLISALVDPNGKTGVALSALLATSFVHYIDAPSLALLVPILQRGFKERGTDIKKKAAQIMGNMASLTDEKDLIPYLEVLMPGLKEVLADPVPEARATAAKAFGNMVARLGEGKFPGLVDEMLETLQTDSVGIDRSGAAQGLSEIIAGLGLKKLESLLPDVVAKASSPRGYIREGYMTLLVYLPATHGDKFTPYLGAIIPCVLRGLADEIEPVRDASMKTGQMIVRNYATTAIDLLLPELERGLFDVNWRIRQSSVQLMGDLLYRIAGVNAKIDLDAVGEEEGLGTEHGRQKLVDALGKERYHKVLASLYVARADSTAIVRQASLHVWKAIVSNTPRTLKEILPMIMDILVASLSSSSVEKSGAAARCLGDLVRKLGDSILHSILPILKKGLTSDQTQIRQGVCVAMTEIMTAGSKTQVEDFVVDSIELVRDALVDEASEVREAAAQTYDILHEHLGRRAIDEVLPSLLNMLKSGEQVGNSLYALEALKEIMAVRSNVVFPVLIPTLTTRPITAFNARALTSLISVAGGALSTRVRSVLPTLMSAVDEGDEAADDLQETLQVLLANVDDDDGVREVLEILSAAVRTSKCSSRIIGCDCFRLFCENNKMEVDMDELEDWVGMLIELLHGEQELVKSAWAALDALVKRVKKEEMEMLVNSTRRAVSELENTLESDEAIAGFCLPKGISPVLPIFLQGLMYGSSDNREQAALGLGDLVRRTSAEAIRPFVTQITGPLIRVIGDRVTSGVKSAILMTLNDLLEKVPTMLKPFLPQLQRTFVKTLSDPTSRQVRDRAARCLSALIQLQPRLDPLVLELVQGVRNAEETGVREAMWEAVYGVIHGLGSGRDIGDASRKGLQALLSDTFSGSKDSDADDGVRLGAAKVFAAFCKHIGVESKSMIGEHIAEPLCDPQTPWTRSHAALLSLTWTLTEAPSAISAAGKTEEVVTGIARSLADEKPQVNEAAIEASGRILAISDYVDAGAAKQIVPALVGIIAPTSQITNDTRRTAVETLRTIGNTRHDALSEHIDSIITVLMQHVKGRTPVRAVAERAMVAVLQIGKDEEVLQAYLSTLDAANAKAISEYVRKTLTKLVEQDNDEVVVVY